MNVSPPAQQNQHAISLGPPTHNGYPSQGNSQQVPPPAPSQQQTAAGDGDSITGADAALYALQNSASQTEKFFMTAADQATGTRDERLAKVIRAKYEAGLLKPYNYVKGYKRLSTWMEKK
jgi:hypothetical protein